MLRVYRSSLWVTDNLELVWLHHSAQRVVEHGGILWCPEVYVQCVQAVHVFALVVWVWRGQMPLRAVLVRARCRAAILAPEAIHGQGEETWVLVRVFSADRVEL